MKKILLITFLSFYGLIYSQKWEFKTGGNSFDGKYSSALIKGVGTDFPYNKPVMVVNLFNDESLNFYISGSGYFQDEEDMEILLVFDENTDELYRARDFSISKDGRTIFFSRFQNVSSLELFNNLEFFEKLKIHNKIEIRVNDIYGKNDMRFSLIGSTYALEKVISKTYLNKKQQLENEILEAKAELEMLNAELEKKLDVHRSRIDSLLLDIGFENDEAISARKDLEYRLKSEKTSFEDIHGITPEISYLNNIRLNIVDKSNNELFYFYINAPKHFQLLKEEADRKKRQKAINDSLNHEIKIKENLKAASNKISKLVDKYEFGEETLSSLYNELEKNYRQNNYNILNIDKLDIIKPYKDGKVLVRFYAKEDKWLFTLTDVHFPDEFRRKLRTNKSY
jgi:hypothetical protein